MSAPEERRSEPLPFAAAAILRVAAVLVPAVRQERWREEWEAEMWHRRERNRKLGRLEAAVRADLTVRALGALPHAAWEAGRGIETVTADLRFAVRQLARNPGFTLAAGLTLALGIGTATAIFSIVNAVLLKPLPYESPGELVIVWHTAPARGFERINNTAGTFLTYRDEATSFESLGAWNEGGVTVTGGGEPERVAVVSATEETLRILGVEAVIGRSFGADDTTPEAPLTTVLSYSYWTRRFGADPTAVGRTIYLGGKPAEIIGVLPEGMRFLDVNAALFLPIQFEPERDGATLSFDYRVIGRLRPGVSLEQASADVNRLLPVSDSRYAWIGSERMEEWALRSFVRPLAEAVVGDVGRTLWLLLGAVGLVLLLACANVANLLLVRAETRRREVALRSAIGAPRSRLARQLVTESLTLGLLGGAGGIVIAHFGLQILLWLSPAGLPRLAEVRLDGSVLLFVLAVSVFSGVLFALMPLAWYGNPDLTTALRDGGRGGSEGRRGQRARAAIAAGEVGLAVVLLVGCALMVRTLMELGAINPGVKGPAEVLSFRVALPHGEVGDVDETVLAWRRILEGVEQIPGVSSAGLVSGLTMERWSNDNVIHVEGSDAPDGDQRPFIHYKGVGGDYFQAMGIPLLAGRALDWNDMTDRRPVGLITENLAREYWGSPAAALGGRVRHDPDDPWREIVGVVADVRDAGFRQEPPGVVYWPLAVAHFLGMKVWVRRNMALVARTPGIEPLSIVPQARQAVWSVNANLPLINVRTMDEVLATDTLRTRFVTIMLTIAAGIAVVLAVIGVYGVIAYSVAQQRQELGIRIALGASARDVSGLVLRRGGIVGVIGVVVGLAAAVGVSRLLDSLLFGVSPLDVPTYAAIAAGLLGIVLAASFIPARRASAVDPATALRWN